MQIYQFQQQATGLEQEWRNACNRDIAGQQRAENLSLACLSTSIAELAKRSTMLGLPPWLPLSFPALNARTFTLVTSLLLVRLKAGSLAPMGRHLTSRLMWPPPFGKNPRRSNYTQERQDQDAEYHHFRCPLSCILLYASRAQL